MENKSAPCDADQDDSQESHILSILLCIKYLAHACQCKDANCRLPSCQKMKIVVQHTERCRQKANGGCSICKQFTALCCYHAKHCEEARCPIPFCMNIKNKLKRQQLQQRLQQAQILKRQIANIQNRGMSDAVLGMNPGNSKSSSQPPRGSQPHSSPHPSQPGKRRLCDGSQSEDLSDSGNVAVKRACLVTADATTVQKDVKDLLYGDDHDVIIKVKGREYKAHKSILEARCSVFAAMFKHKMKEGFGNSITIEDCDPEAFGKFLEYIYTGKVENIDINTTMKLYCASDKYDVPGLKEICIKLMKASLPRKNICDVIKLAMNQ